MGTPPRAGSTPAITIRALGAGKFGAQQPGSQLHHRVGNQHRVYLRDVLELAKKRDAERLASMDRLSRDAFEAGLYDRNVPPEGGSDE